MVEELDRGSFAILEEKEREYVDGVKMLLHLQEPVSEEVAQRVKEIYVKFKKTMHLAMQPKS
jgi:hypothetical protein